MTDSSLQLQADYLPREKLDDLLVEGHWAPVLRRLLSGENLLLEGCRGTGKTMLMRAAAERLAKAVKSGGKTLGIHTTFKRYLATIPAPGTTGPELGNFKAWVNARILSALKEQLELVFGANELDRAGIVGKVDWTRVIAVLETTYRGEPAAVSSELLRDTGLDEVAFRGLQGYTYTLDLLQTVRRAFGINLFVLLLDDAAHTLDTRAQGAFFTLIKSLYAEGLAFKISVYPAVTRYGLDFSYGHDAVVVSLAEIPRPDVMENYVSFLRRRTQLADDGDAKALIEYLSAAHPDWVRLIVYCSNGNPRGILNLLSQILVNSGGQPPASVRYDDVRNAINQVMDRHMERMVPGVVKDLDPRLLSAAEMLLGHFRDKLHTSPGPIQGTQPRMFLALTNSMQIPYLCTSAIGLLVAANVLVPQGSVRLGKRENGTTYLLHPGFVFRDNVLGGSNIGPERWLQHFDAMSPRIHAEVSKAASLWEEVRDEAMEEPSGRCANGHPMMDLTIPCDSCGAIAHPRGPADVLLAKDIDVLALSDAIKRRLREHGFGTVRKVFEAKPRDLDAIPFIGEKRVSEIRAAVEAAVDEFFAG